MGHMPRQRVGECVSYPYGCETRPDARQVTCRWTHQHAISSVSYPWGTRQLGYETPARTPDCVGIREARNKSSCTREGEATYLRIGIQPSEPLAKTGSNMTSMCRVGDRGALLTLAPSWSSAQN
jgi:hypothetical protein